MSGSKPSFQGGAFGGPPATVNLQQMSDLVAAVTNRIWNCDVPITTLVGIRKR